MRHYFIDRKRDIDEYFTFTESFLGRNFTIYSASDMFSKNKFDSGSLALVTTIKKYYNKIDNVLDMCCGYGTIGILLYCIFGCDIDMCDINETAVSLAKKNAVSNNCKINNFFVSDGLINIEKNYDFIVSNPPIKVGKSVYLRLFQEAYNHLNNQGQFLIVIRKDKGAKSCQKFLENLFDNCEILAKDCGYYILKCIKHV